MGSYEEHVRNLINATSKDVLVGTAIRYLVGLLRSVADEHVIIGSASIQSCLSRCQRVPGDLDALVSEEAIADIKRACEQDPNLRFVEHAIACKVYYGEEFYLHLIPRKMRLMDKIAGTAFTAVNLFYWDRTEERDLHFVAFDEPIRLRAPVVEYALCMSLNRPIDANTFSSYTALLQCNSLRREVVQEFVDRVPVIGRVVRVRLETLRRLLDRDSPSLSHKLPIL